MDLVPQRIKRLIPVRILVIVVILYTMLKVAACIYLSHRLTR